MSRIEEVATRVMATREELCSERIAAVERTERLEARTVQVEEARQKLKEERQRAQSLYSPVLECLDYQVQWADEVRTVATAERGCSWKTLSCLAMLIECGKSEGRSTAGAVCVVCVDSGRRGERGRRT